MRNAGDHQCKVKMSGSEKKVNKKTWDISSIKAKQRQRNVQKSVLQRAKLLFC